MDMEPIQSREQDTNRGIALLVTGAVMVLLRWVLPPVAPVAIAAYGVWRLFRKEVGEGLLALAIAVLAWVLRGFVGGVLWMIGAVVVAAGLFFLIRGLRSSASMDS